MKTLFVAGVVLLLLGVASLVFPIPHREREGLRGGHVAIGVTTMLVGAGMLLTARSRRR